MTEERFDYGIRLTNFFPQDILDGLLEFIKSDTPPDNYKGVPLSKTFNDSDVDTTNVVPNQPCDEKLGQYHAEKFPIVKKAQDFVTRYFHTHEDSLIVKEGNGWVDYDVDESPYTCVGELQTTPPRCRYGVHQDTPSKMHTLIIYLHPQEGNGTKFFSALNPDKTRGIGGVEDKWGINCGYWMGIDRERPYHSYQNDTDETRWIFMYNLGKKIKIPLDNR